MLSKKIAEANKKYLGLEVNDKEVSAKAIHRNVKKKEGQGSFITQSELYLDLLVKEGKYNRAQSDRPRINRFIKFVNNQNIAFNEITVNLLKKFKAHLKEVYKVSDRTAINYLIVLRTIYNQGIKDGVAEEKSYPFGKKGISLKFPESLKQGLDKEEILSLKNVDLTNYPKMNDARNTWLMSFYFAGMRVSDVLKLRWSDIDNDRLKYRMGKNQKVLSIKIPQGADSIIESYIAQKEENDGLIFPYLKGIQNWEDEWLIQRKVSYSTKTINKYLKRTGILIGLDKPISTHIARHSFGSIAGDKIPIQTLQKLYRHSDIKTTINYQKSFIHDTDNALEEVVNF